MSGLITGIAFMTSRSSPKDTRAVKGWHSIFVAILMLAGVTGPRLSGPPSQAEERETNTRILGGGTSRSSTHGLHASLACHLFSISMFPRDPPRAVFPNAQTGRETRAQGHGCRERASTRFTLHKPSSVGRSETPRPHATPTDVRWGITQKCVGLAPMRRGGTV